MEDVENLSQNSKSNNGKAWIVLLVFLFLLFQGNKSSPVENYTQEPSINPTDIIFPTETPPSPFYLPETFNGYECTEDCSGHEAGYNWAEEKGIDNIDDCDGNSDSFIEGCKSYVEENYPEDNNYNDYEDIDDY